MMPHYSTSRNGMTKYGKKTGGGGAKVKGAGSNTDKGKKKKKGNPHNEGY